MVHFDQSMVCWEFAKNMISSQKVQIYSKDVINAELKERLWNNAIEEKNKKWENFENQLGHNISWKFVYIPKNIQIFIIK